MKLLRKRGPNEAVIAGLEALKLEYPSAIDRSYIDDMILYAQIGRDRHNLDGSWVAKTRAQLEKFAKINSLWEEA